MGRHSIVNKGRILKDVKLLRYVARGDLLDFYRRGNAKRIKAFEEDLPDLEQEERVGVVRHKGEKVYSPARKNKAKKVSLEHEVTCSHILIRLWRCRMEESELVPERAFRGFAIVPEWGIRYSDERGTMLIFEYSTHKNFTHGGVIKSKLTRYIKYLPEMQEAFQRDITVLFVIDIHRTRLVDFLERVKTQLEIPVRSDYSGKYFYPFFFTDLVSFKAVSGLGSHLRAKIYLWGYDRQVYRLEHDDD